MGSISVGGLKSHKPRGTTKINKQTLKNKEFTIKLDRHILEEMSERGGHRMEDPPDLRQSR